MEFLLILLVMMPIYFGYFLAILLVPLLVTLGMFSVIIIGGSYFVYWMGSLLFNVVDLVPVFDDGSPLIDFSLLYPQFVAPLLKGEPIFARAAVGERVVSAQRAIPDEFKLRVVSCCSSGAAIDVRLVYARSGEEVDMGSMRNSGSEEGSTAAWFLVEPVTAAQKYFRELMGSALASVGFVRKPDQWWHWSYGDREWALQTANVNSAIFGPVRS